MMDKLKEACVDRVVVSESEIHRRLNELAPQIAGRCGGKQLVILAVMTGSLIFLADLIRRLPLLIRVSLVWASSYRGGCTPGASVELGQMPDDLGGADVLILDDILDTGRTIGALQREVLARNARSVMTCVLLKKVRAGVNHRPKADFVGFEIADEFVVGYGLDFDNLYRNLPDICVLKVHASKQ